jgi:hypothetical protein
MAATLQEILLAPDTKPRVVADCFTLIDQEVSRKQGEEVSQALLSVTDARSAASGRPTVIKAYGSVRGTASKHIVAALPRVGDLVMKYAG